MTLTNALCVVCETVSERSTQMHLRSDHKRKESEIAELLSRAKAGSLGCNPAAKLLRKMFKAPSSASGTPIAFSQRRSAWPVSKEIKVTKGR